MRQRVAAEQPRYGLPHLVPARGDSLQVTGSLLVADIAGYTVSLNAARLEQAQGILEGLINRSDAILSEMASSPV